MIKLNRTTEYSLLALSYIRQKKVDETVSAREISEYYKLPFEILAKTLQKLKEQGIISSTYGTRGGYVLAKNLKDLNFAEFLSMMEGPLSVVSCTSLSANQTSQESRETSSSCEFSSGCSIKSAMSVLNHKLYDFLNRISLEELTSGKIIPPVRSLEENTLSTALGGEP
jgi:Rrf2 family protein